MLVGMWNNRNSYSLLVVIQNGITKHTLKPFSPAVVLLGVYPKELKTYIQPETCTQIFIAALAIIAKTWKQPRCPLVHGWINELWYSGSWWWTGRPGVLQFMGSRRVRHDWSNELNWIVRFSQHHLLKRLSLPHCIFLPPLSKIRYP